MRSRYSAFTRNAIDYLVATHDPATLDAVDVADLTAFAASTTWRGLTVDAVEAGGPDDTTGRVRFTAAFAVNGVIQSMGEDSLFRRLDDGRWVYSGQADAGEAGE